MTTTNRISKFIFISLIALLMIQLKGTAQVSYFKTPIVNFSYNTSATTNNLIVRNSNRPAACGNPQPNLVIRKARLGVILDWKGDYDPNYAANNTQYTVNLTINAYSTYTGSTGLLNTYNKTLVVNTNKPQSYFEFDFTGNYYLVNRFAVTATYVRTGAANTAIEQVINTKAYFTEDFDYTVSSATPMINPYQMQLNSNQSEVTFKWSSYCGVPAPNYQFQLLKLYNTNVNKTSNEADIDASIDWNQALTIETGNSLEQLSLSLTEGTGYYVWRVRPIGNAYEGSIANDLNWGLWSDAGVYTQGANVSITNTYTVTTSVSSYLLYYKQFDENKNWIFTRTFVEGDATTNGQTNIGEAINYANGLQMAQQQQARLKADQKKIVGATIYDNSNRPALSTLPAPVTESGLGYISSYIKNPSGAVYTAADFDEDANYLNPTPFNQTGSGPGYYYSTNNTMETNVPSASGYPYSRTLYMNDGTSKPKEQGAPGPDHKLGNAVKHTTRNYTSGVADAELIRVFGDEAPDAKGVLKTITTDANNASSVAYISKEGQTIATCLSNPGATNLDPLTPVATGLTLDYFIDNNSAYGSNGLIAFKNIVVTEPTNVNINYSLTPNTYQDNCANFCATCDYRFTIKIINNDDPSVAALTYTQDVPATQPGTCVSSAIAPYTTTVNLAPGSYTIQRIIESNQVNPSTTPPAGTVANSTYIEQFSKQIENAIIADFNSGNATIVDDAGVLISGSPAVNMTTLRSYLPLPTTANPNPAQNIEGLYTYLGIAQGSTQNHVNIKIGCNIVTLPVEHCASGACPANNDFEKYYTDWYFGKYNTTTTIASLLPGYAAGEFNTVIANMINCGAYNCQTIFNCWKSVVASKESMDGLAATNLSSSYSGLNMPGTSFAPNYLDMFLSCAGYKLTGINNNPGGAGCASPGYKFHPYAYFKYTETTPAPANRCSNCEYLYTNTSPGTLANFITAFNTTSTTSDQKKQFFDCIKTCNTQTTGVPTPVNFGSTAVATCNSSCAERFNEFVASIIDQYHRNNIHVQGDLYQLVNNPVLGYYTFNTIAYTAQPGDVTMSTITCQAQSLVKACQSNCVLTTSTVNGQTSVGTAAEHQAMANAMYGAYDINVTAGSNCPSGYSSTPPAGSSSASFYINSLNQRLSIERQNAPVKGFYWDYRSYLINNLGASILSNDCANLHGYVFVHPDIPSYFEWDATTLDIVYLFNKQLSGTTLAPKRLYSTNASLTPGSGNIGFFFTTQNTSVSAAITLDASTVSNSYLIDASFNVFMTNTFTTNPAFKTVSSQVNNNTLNLSDAVTNYTSGYWRYALCPKIMDKMGLSCGTICYKIKPLATINVTDPTLSDEIIDYNISPCESEMASQMLNSLNSQMAAIINNKTSSLKAQYRNHCIDLLSDQLKASYNVNYHHYTLFYCDRAGNLVKTVPPKGVVYVSSRSVHPAHTLVTEYAYNSLSQLVRKKTPDGGEIKFWYDNLVRLKFSQSAQQLADSKMSYTKFDALGRAIETGQMPAINLTATEINDINFPATGGTDITANVYSNPANGVSYFGGKTQRFLQGNISYSFTDKDGDPATTNDKVTSYFSYDAHENLEWVIQDIPEVGRNYIAYEYDLISRKVIKIKYNEGFADKFYQRYTYDITKRLKTVETSSDGIFWEKDANYIYYLHGSLKREEIGHDKLQGQDYYYTIQGWLKGINHIDNTLDPGQDGTAATTNSSFAKDVYGMGLGYYSNDFIISNSAMSAQLGTFATDASRDLFNGNISAWTSNYDYSSNTLGSTMYYHDKATAKRFKYDELNRLTEARFSSQNPGTKIWTANDDYLEQFSYDANGNISSLLRNSSAANPSGLAMDNFTYNYPAANNQLGYTSDLVSATSYSNDIDNQTAGNYTYDLNGNLIRDNTTGEGLSINWNLAGKVSRITKDNGLTLEFLYDATGQRVYKKVYKPAMPITDANYAINYYITDASGKSMAIYKRTNPTTTTASFELIEQPIYGNGRLGERVLSGDFVRTVNLDANGNPTPQNLPSSIHISGATSIMVPLANTTGTQLYVQDLNANSTTNTASDLSAGNQIVNEGTAGVTISNARSQACLLDDAGNPILKAYTYTRSTGETKTILSTASYTNIPNCTLINSGANNQAIFVKKPGSCREYYYITIGTDNKPYFHVIDITANVLLSYNNLIDNSATYGQTMAVIDDRVGDGASTLYLRSYSGGTTTIKTFSIGSNEITLANSNAASFASNAQGNEGEIQVSSLGTKLAIANNVGTNGEVYLYSLSSDHQNLNSLGKINFNAGTSARYIEFSQNDVRIYFTQRTGTTSNSVYRVATSVFTGPATSLSFGYASLVTSTATTCIGSIRKGANNNIYYLTNTTAAPTTSNIYMISSCEATPVLGAANAIAGSVTTGSLPIQAHIISYTSPTAPVLVLNRSLAKKVYEIKDHLANVHVSINDVKVPVYNGSTFSNYRATALSISDYFAFGSEMPMRTITSNKYRYGLNGQEKTDEINGSGNHNTALFWEYDTRLGRRWNLDPKPQIDISDYACFANNPILNTDYLGDEVDTKLSRKTRKALKLSRKEARNTTPEFLKKLFNDEYGILVEMKNGKLVYTGEGSTTLQVSENAKKMWIEELKEGKQSKHSLNFVYNKEKIELGENSTKKDNDGNVISTTTTVDFGDFDELTGKVKGDIYDPNVPVRAHNLARVLEHEMLGHGVLQLHDAWDQSKTEKEHGAFTGHNMTGDVVEYTNQRFNKQMSLPYRITYYGKMGGVYEENGEKYQMYYIEFSNKGRVITVGKPCEK